MVASMLDRKQYAWLRCQAVILRSDVVVAG
jgi:hypothetical protein